MANAKPAIDFLFRKWTLIRGKSKKRRKKNGKEKVVEKSELSYTRCTLLELKSTCRKWNFPANKLVCRNPWEFSSPVSRCGVVFQATLLKASFFLSFFLFDLYPEILCSNQQRQWPICHSSFSLSWLSWIFEIMSVTNSLLTEFWKDCTLHFIHWLTNYVSVSPRSIAWMIGALVNSRVKQYIICGLSLSCMNINHAIIKRFAQNN